MESGGAGICCTVLTVNKFIVLYLQAKAFAPPLINELVNEGVPYPSPLDVAQDRFCLSLHLFLDVKMLLCSPG